MFIQLGISGATTMYSSYYEIPINYIPAFCKLWYYILQATSIMYRWMLAIACIDRYALSSTNPYLRSWAQMKYAYRIIVGNLIVSIIFPIHILVMYDARGRNCGVFNNSPGSLYNAIIAIINTGIIPVVIMITFTWLIRKNLKQRQERRQMWANQQSADNREEQTQRKRDQQALTMLFVQISAFIILIAPWLIFNIYHVFSFNVVNKLLDRVIFEGFLTFLTGTMALFFAAISFYLYTLTSNIFRRELLAIIYCIFCCLSKQNHEQRRIEPMTINTRQ